MSAEELQQAIYEEEEGKLSTRRVLAEVDPRWERNMRARLLSDTDYQFLRRYDKKDPHYQDACLRENGEQYVQAMLNALKNASSHANNETLLYTLALMDDMLTVDPTRARLFHQTKEAQEGGLFAIFQRTLQDRQWPVQEKAGKVAAHLAARAPGDGSKDAVAMADGVLGWMKGMLSEDFPGEEGEERAAAALQVLDALAINRSMRGKAMEAGIPELLGPLLAPERVAEMSPQRQYEATLALWLLSFEEGALGRFKEGGLLQGLLALLKGAPKEKVVRAGLMALANLLDRANGRNDAWVELAEHGLPRLVTALRARSFADEELNDALERVAKKSESSVKEATSLDKFKREVESGSLDWTRVHTDDSFWRAHVHDLEEDDWGPVRGLLQLLTSSSSSSKTLQVAAHDLGCFAQYHPRGRNVLTDIGAKDAVVKIMAHTDPEVRKHALLASQKILVSRWEFLSGYGA